MGARGEPDMIREQISQQFDHDPHFRWRGTNVTRLENLSDIVFALALGMIVSASGVPTTFTDLENFLLSIIPVTAAFMILIEIWHSHFTFFRRFGIADKRIILLNSVLLFGVLFVAYPLRFAFDSLFSFILMASGSFARAEALELTYERSGIILAYFAMGYALIQTLLLLMYRHALAHKDALNLTKDEITLARGIMYAYMSVIIVSFTVAALAYFTPMNGFAGWAYFLTWPAAYIIGQRFKVSGTTSPEPDGGSG